MAEQMRPASPQQAPDPAHSYERANPDREAGQGRLDNNTSTPTDDPDRLSQAVTHKQDPTRQINGHDDVGRSMKDEEPLGEDQVPTDVHDKRQQRHPRREGRAGRPEGLRGRRA